MNLKAIFSIFLVIGMFYPCASIEIYKIMDRTPLSLTIPANGQIQIMMDTLPSGSAFATFQAHSQRKNITVSLVENPDYFTSVTNRDAGVLTRLYRFQQGISWFLFSPHSEPLKTELYAAGYGANDPVPGGCNMEFNLDLDPNTKTRFNGYKSMVLYQYANKGYKKGGIQPDCENLNFWSQLKYDLYYYYLPSRDLKEADFFTAIKRMYTVDDIKKYGTKMMSQSRGGGFVQPLIYLESFRSRGIIFNVIATQTWESGQETSAAYVPSSTYACDIGDDNNTNCNQEAPIAILVVIGISGFLSLVLCFFGHRLLKFQMFCMGFIAFILVVYILLSLDDESSYLARVIISIISGIIGGVLWVTMWWCCGVPVLSVLLTGLVCGYLFASILFFTPLGNLSFWENQFNYGMTFGSTILVIPVFLLAFTKKLSIIATSLIGSYGVIASLSMFLHGTLHHIFLYSFYKATLASYMKVKIYPPFEEIDKILSACWILLFLLGLIFQFIRERNRPDFPECPRKQRKRRRQLDYPLADDEHAFLIPPEMYRENSPPIAPAPTAEPIPSLSAPVQPTAPSGYGTMEPPPSYNEIMSQSRRNHNRI